MKSFYAVVGQMILSGSNYLVFLVFTFLLAEEDFIAFSTAVALNMLAYAVAEGGISYVAPREISRKFNTKAVLAGGFIGISISLYLITLFVGFNAWNLFSKDPLSFRWVVAYAIYFFPVLLIPSWLTCRSIDFLKLLVLSVLRGVSVLFVFFVPSFWGLFISGLFFLVFTFFFVRWLNVQNTVVKFPNAKSFRVAIRMAMEVFVSKTSSYVVYSLIPLVVASVYGNKISSLYMVGERIKSMYSTFFQPLILTVYLSISDKREKKMTNKLPVFIALLNVFITFLLILVIYFGWVHYLGERFSTVSNLHYYIIAACFSILTSCLLYFKVLPNGNYKLFRFATYFQLIIFVILFFVMSYAQLLSPEGVLLIGEFSIFFIVCLQLMLKINTK